MPYELFLALRYLYSRRRKTAARATALAAILGIAIGVAALIVALALANGFRDEMRDKILRGTSHLSLMRKDGEPISDWPAVVKRVSEIGGVKQASATTYDAALLTGPKGSAYTILRGLDGSASHVVADLRTTLVAGDIEPVLNEAVNAGEQKELESNESSPSDSGPNLAPFSEAPSDAALPVAVIGADLATRTGLNVGEVAQILSGDAQLTPLGLAPRFRRIRIAGIFRSGLYEYDATWVYVSLTTAASLRGVSPTSAPVIAIEVNDIYAVSQVAGAVRNTMGADYTTIDWQEANRPLFAALALERRIGALIIALIILIATLNITATLVLVVVERRADIAILIAMGARARSITLLFVIEGAFIGLIGAIAGAVIGLATCFIGDRYKLVSLPPDVYSLSNVPFHTRAEDVAIAALVAFLLSLIATVYPARTAARVRPAEALRDT